MALAIFRNRDHTQICKSLQTETFEILDRYKIKDLLPTFHDLRRQNILYQHNSSSEKDQPLNILLTNFMIAERSEEKSIPIIHRWFLLRAGCPRNSPAIAHLLQHVRWSWQEVEINWSSPPFAILLWPLTRQFIELERTQLDLIDWGDVCDHGNVWPMVNNHDNRDAWNSLFFCGAGQKQRSVEQGGAGIGKNSTKIVNSSVG